MARFSRHGSLAALLIPALVTASCSTPPASVAPTQPGTTEAVAAAQPGDLLLDGFATAGLPLERATVSLQGLDGQPMNTAEALPVTLSADGHFALMLRNPPRDFRVVVKGGTLDGAPFAGELRAEVRDFGPQAPAVSVDLVSTLISHTMQAQSQKDLQAAVQAVRTYLALPADALSHRRAFDATAFLAAATASGGLEAYMGQSVEAIARGATTSFAPIAVTPPEGLLQSPVAIPVAQFVATNLAAGGVSAIGGFAMNQLLGAFGASDGAQMKAILQKLDTLLGEVARVQNRIDDLDALMRGLAANTDFQAKQQRLNDHITRINYLDNEYKSLAALAVKGDAAKIRQKQDSLKAYLTARFPFPKEALQVWRDELVGHGGASEGLIGMWYKVVNTKYPKYYNQKVAQTGYDQWAYWDAYQARLVLYLSAAIEAGAYPGVEQDEFLAQWQKNRTAQLGMLRGVPSAHASDTLDLSRFELANQVTALKAVPAGVVVDTHTKKMYADRVSLVATPAQYDSNAQKACDIPDRATGLHGWGIPTVADFKALKNLNGQGVKFKDMGFAGNLDVHSYVFWTSEQVAERDLFHIVKYMQVWHDGFREVGGFWGRIPPEIHTDTWHDGLALLPVRSVPDAELKTYVY